MADEVKKEMVECPDCRGDGINECSCCGGDGYEECSSCDGTGKVEEEDED
jgi:DnaJ-class molecular chaperone